MLHAVNLFARKLRGGVARGLCVRTRQNVGKPLHLHERMVYARLYPVRSVVQSARKKPVGRAALKQAQVGGGGAEETRVPVGKTLEHRHAAVGGSAAPVRPFEASGAEASVYCAVGEHELQVGGGDFRNVVAQFRVSDKL